jgi:hypothetical protein
VAALLVALSAIFVLAGGTLELQFWVNSDDAPDSTPAKFLTLAPGDCIRDKYLQTASLDDLALVSCTEPHGAEVIASANYPLDAPTALEDRVPGGGTEVRQEWLKQNCWPAFASYVGIPVEQSTYNVAASFPSPELRSAGATRTVCMVVNMDLSPLTQSVKGIAK